MIIPQNKTKITATILARNEEDIIGRNLAHHLSQGVTNFIVTLNCCTDKTKQIVEKFPEVAEIIEEPEDAHDQSKWVTRMARMACKLKPDWIVHLDADEFWCGLTKLRKVTTQAIGSQKMLMHPPVAELKEFDPYAMRYYLSTENIPGLPGECKVAHRPIEDIVISHGNHGIEFPTIPITYTNLIYRHHYPIRSYEQFERKTIEGHEALMKRNAPCPRWKLWYETWQAGKLRELYDEIVSAWSRIIKPSGDVPIAPDVRSAALLRLLRFWCTPEAITYIQNSNIMPIINSWT
jgi:hypothetical protein